MPVRTLRNLVRDKKLAALKGPDGSWTFNEMDLDAIAAGGKPIGAAIAVPSAVPAAPAASSAAIAPTMTGTTNPLAWAEAIVAARDTGGIQDDNAGVDQVDEVEVDVQRLTSPPLGSLPMTGWPYTCSAVASRASSVQVRVVELERQVADLTSQLEQVCGERDRLRIVCRDQRCTAISATEALQVVLAGRAPHVAQAVGAVAWQAAASLDDRADDAHVHAVARDAGLRVAASWDAWQHEQAALQAEADRPRRDEVSQARRRRGHRGSRSRW